MRKLTLVRHATPEVRPDQHPSRWPLTVDGRRAAAELGSRLPKDGVLASSPELKAIETLCWAAAVDDKAVRTDRRFTEVSRPGEPFDDDHRSRRLAWVTGRLDERHAGWELPEEAAARFQSGLDAVDGNAVVVATHGMIIAAWLTSIGYVSRGDSVGELWAELRFPDLVTLTLPG